MTNFQFGILIRIITWSALSVYLLGSLGCNAAPIWDNEPIEEAITRNHVEPTITVATHATPNGVQTDNEPIPSDRSTTAPTAIVTALPNESSTATLISASITPTRLTPTPIVTPTPTPILFLTVAAANDGCILYPGEVETLTLPMPHVLIGSSGPNEQFCILWHSDNPNVTSFVVEIQYENSGGMYTYTLPSDTTYVALPENEAPNCSNRRSFHISVYMIIAESQRLLGGMGVNDGCFQ